MGYETAHSWFHHHNLTGVGDVRRAASLGTLTLTRKQEDGVRYHTDLQVNNAHI